MNAVLLADSDSGRASPIGLFVILVLCVAVYFLWRSLNRHLKRVPPTFDPPRKTDPPGKTTNGSSPGTVRACAASFEAAVDTKPDGIADGLNDLDGGADSENADAESAARDVPGGTGNPQAMR
jgi:hypothetical protein